MALREAKVDIILNEGLNENIHPKLLPQGILRELKDGILDKEGAAIKRPGFAEDPMAVLSAQAPFSGNTVGNVCRLLAPPNGEVALLDDKFVWTRNTELASWAPKAEWGSLKGERIDFGSDAVGNILQSDCSVSDGLLCVVYQMVGSGGFKEIFSTIIEVSTGTVLRSHVAVFSGASAEHGPPRVIVVNGVWVCVSARTLTGYVASKLSVAAPSAAWTAAVTLVATAESGFDICTTAGNEMCLAHYTVAGGVIVWRIFDVAVFAAGATGTVATGVGTQVKGISLLYDGATIHTAYYWLNGASIDVAYKRFTSALVPLGSVAIVAGLTLSVTESARVAVGYDSASSRAIVAFGLESGANIQLGMEWQGVNTGTYALVGTAHLLLWHLPVSQIATLNGQFVMLVSTSNWIMEPQLDWPSALRDYPAHVDGIFAIRIDPTLLLTTSLARVVGVYAAGEGIGVFSPLLAGLAEFPPVPALASDGTNYFCAQALVLGDGLNGGAGRADPYCRSTVLKLLPSAIERGTQVGSGDQVVVLGGCPTVYDGSNLPEPSACWRPSVLKLIEGVASSGGYNPGGTNPTYFFAAVVKWTDRKGNIYWSEVSPISSIKLANIGSAVTIKLRATPLSNKGDWYPSTYLQPKLIVLRGSANDSQVLRHISPSGTDLSLTLSPNDWYSVVSLGESTSDSRLELAYNTGEPQNTVVPSASVGCSANGRIFLRLDENKSRVLYSKPPIATRAPEFSYQTMFLDFPAEIQALSAMDGRVFAFAKKGIYTVDGQGPARNLTGGTFAINELTPGTGTSQPLSVIATPIGIIFANEIGFWLLNRGTQVEPLLATRDSFATHPVVLGAELDPQHNAVRFLCKTDTEHVVLCFNWVRRVWYRHYPSIGGVAACFARIGSTFWMARANKVYWESGYRDGSGQTFYPMITRTGPVRPDGALEGFSRMWYCVPSLVKKSTHGLKVTMTYNALGTVQSVHTWTEAQITAMTNDEKVRVHLKYQKGNYFDVQLEDTAAAAGTAEGFELNGFTFLYGVKKGVGMQMPEAQKG